MISDLRYVDPASPTGEMQTRSILQNIGTSDTVIDWVLTLVRDHREETRGLKKELRLAHMDLNE